MRVLSRIFISLLRPPMVCALTFLLTFSGYTTPGSTPRSGTEYRELFFPSPILGRWGTPFFRSSAIRATSSLKTGQRHQRVQSNISANRWCDFRNARVFVWDVWEVEKLTQKIGFDAHGQLYVILEDLGCFGQVYVLKRLPVHLQYLNNQSQVSVEASISDLHCLHLCKNGLAWSPRLSPASSALLPGSTVLMKRCVPRSAPPISVKGRGVSREALVMVTTLDLALAAHAMLSNRN